jgi:hypothetical protein
MVIIVITEQHRKLRRGRREFPTTGGIRRCVSPKAVLNDRVARFGSNPNPIIEASVGQTLYIQVNRRAIDLNFRAANDVEFFLTDCQCLQRVMVFLSLILEPSWSAARSERE